MEGAFSLFQEKCSSLNIVLICAFTLPENAPSRSAISQVDIQTAVAGTCTLPFSPMVMISLFINIPPYYMVMPLNCSIRLNLSERVFMSRLSFSWVILAQICVVRILVCPSILESVSMGTPFVRQISVAMVWRLVCHVMFFSIPQSPMIVLRFLQAVMYCGTGRR